MNEALWRWDGSLPLAAGGVTGGQLALIAVIMVVMFLLLMSNARRRREGGPSPKAYAREQISRIKEERAVKTDLADLMLELQQLAREVNAQLDTKFVKLERCIADADQRIGRLDRLAGRPAGQPALDTTVRDESTEAQPVESSRRERICALYDEGKSPLEIAQALDKPVGEVELVVSLRRPKTGKKLSAQA